ncbi:hypothetical protein [Candidatus Chlorohelix sp.]|uniref:hypothetical protein n=1 Tax=Candidatus Chlorohelix sp. TaxID=3139201 RepID=UPI003070F4E7
MARNNRNTNQTQDWMSEKGGNPQDWMQEKQQNLDDIFDEKAGITRRSPLNQWGLIMLVAILLLGVAVILIVALTNKPVSTAAVATVEPTSAALTVVANNRTQAQKLLSDATNQINQCADNPCSNYPKAIRNLTEASNLLRNDAAINDKLKESYLTYSKQLFKAATNPDSFRLGLDQLRAAKDILAGDKDLTSLEEIADFYQQGWSKLNAKKYDDASGKFKIVWEREPNFYNISSLYYGSLLEYAKQLLAANNPEEAAFHLKTALNLNVNPTEIRGIAQKSIPQTIRAKYNLG